MFKYYNFNELIEYFDIRLYGKKNYLFEMNHFELETMEQDKYEI